MLKKKKEDFRKISSDFQERINFIKRIPSDVATKLFFELCDFHLHNYIATEKKRFPEKSIKEIIIEMYERHNKLKKIERERWNLIIKKLLNK